MSAKFKIDGKVSRKPYIGGNFAYVSVQAGDKTYLDVAVFEDGPLDQVRELQQGQPVAIDGEVRSRKTKFVEANGKDHWEPQLVVTSIKVGGAKAAPTAAPKKAPLQRLPAPPTDDSDMPF
jgi:hypothetical protein